ncbi:MAG: hypothetical protein BGO09_00910 [Bacteroidetes bacterium 47-18]|nr:MAG: hypothetical protein BGO09_00910 [Bacteroidetes bacterium 47-18]
MKKILTLFSISLIALASCQKDKSKECTYYNKPLPVGVSFVGYYDYEINAVDLYQYEKGTNFQNFVRKDSYTKMAQYPVVHDTSTVIFHIAHKSDYMVVLPQKEDTFRITDIAYQPDYFSVVEPGGKCDQRKEYYQLPEYATLDGNVLRIVKLTDKTAGFYINKP